MEVSRTIELTRIEEIKILSNVRLILRHDLNHIHTKDNLQAQFILSGEIKGGATCYLCLDGMDLSPTDKNYIFPLFIESMNILIGRQISVDEELSKFKIRLSPPKISMNPKELSTKSKSMIQIYELELDGLSFQILIEYSIEAMN